MNEKYTAQAASQEEAINKGLNALGITREEAIITVEETGKKGFLGFGQKDAVVVIEKKEKIDLVDEFLSNEFDLGDAETDSVKADETDQSKKQPTQTTPKETVKTEKQETKIKKKEEKSRKKIEETKPKDSTDSKEQETKKLNDDEAITAVRDYLKEIILAMGISDVEVYTSRIKEQVKYDIETENAGLVIGRHGKVLNGLQTLIQNHMHQLAESKIFVRVDAEKYRERRRNTVENLARRTADRAIKTKRPVKLDPMPAYERKQIHHYLNGNSKVETHSEGREPKRYLVVKPVEYN